MDDVTPTWRCAARTDTGKVRARNEDAVLALPQHGLWAVADGMGGHQNGALASRLVIEHLADLPVKGTLAQRLFELRQCLHRLNHRLGHELTASADRPDTMIGSTVVALLVQYDRAACVWAGDSRCYLWRARCLYQLSRDHSLVQRLIDERRLTPQQAAQHPDAHALTQAIGACTALKLDVLELDVLPGDVFLLCSDGLYQAVPTHDIGVALDTPCPKQAIERLFQQGLGGPARDNLSAVVIRR
ncbi:PP2C family protein-serine/threonine phosphatase [Pseudomonas typographi]|uniref:PP2C family protein-serine/threonine phosphatase n=1 Tax=Pseudomonas typographi TaxID=2715964 RepID=UPI0016878246|nr:PP2C family serine/threonine-protein phosphatase [Pseudomonas typographi]MBD1553204.1 serine/threonine-protein phosphatase [Pseudomonas typographi]MBD1588084.1 serine/threonine-protein phosphatase [Pseudomonas typographi]